MKLFKNKSPLALALVYITTISVIFMCIGLCAKYSSPALGSDNARVARFEIKSDYEMNQSLPLEVAPEEKKICKIKIQNNSEVSVEYTVNVKAKYGNIPLKYALKDANDVELESIENGAKFSDNIDLGDDKKEYTLEITWDNTKIEESYSGKVDVLLIELLVLQKD